MAELFASGRVVDMILALVGAEAILLAALGRRLVSRRQVPALLANLASGACLLLALRSALLASWWGWIGVFLAAALICHLVGLGITIARQPAVPESRSTR